MLKSITIKDFAIIDNVCLDFNDGLHILTGETGSGKSIVIEAVSMALGSRADTAYVRTGKDKAVIELIASVNDIHVLTILDESGLKDGNDLFITREIHKSGKSICRVNGTIVSVSFLKNLCRNIADVHGQYDHQYLLDPSTHIDILDSYGKENIEKIKEKLSETFNDYTKLIDKKNNILSKQNENIRNRDFMKFELSEIENANLLIGEEEDLNELLLMQKNSELLYSTLQEVDEILYRSDYSSCDGLSKSTSLLDNIKYYSKDYEYLSSIVSECFFKLDDLRSDMRRLKDSISFSQEEINETQERIELINYLKRKYGNSIEKILDYKKDLENKLMIIEDSDALLSSLSEEIASLDEELSSLCKDLSKLRAEAAKSIETAMKQELLELNFSDAELTVSITPLLEDGQIRYSSKGSDQVEFLMCANKGEQPKPLSKVASGGEISRIMLAFKSILGNFDHIPTLIFDEIDSGISGLTASIVGKKMKNLSKTRQVICITHLAQIAAFSDHHYRIYKEEMSGRTTTSVEQLQSDEKIMEIARLLGGLKITDATVKNAKELIRESSL